MPLGWVFVSKAHAHAHTNTLFSRHCHQEEVRAQVAGLPFSSRFVHRRPHSLIKSPGQWRIDECSGAIEMEEGREGSWGDRDREGGDKEREWETEGGCVRKRKGSVRESERERKRAYHFATTADVKMALWNTFDWLIGQQTLLVCLSSKRFIQPIYKANKWKLRGCLKEGHINIVLYFLQLTYHKLLQVICG